MSNDNSRLVLGTAQLGMQYGIANKTQKPDYESAKQIIKTAWESGITEYDTAQAYGESEQILGNIFKELGIADKVSVVSKLSPNIDHTNYSSVRQNVLKSLDYLNIEKLDCLMLHRENYIDEWESGIKDVMGKIEKEGLADSIGISVYHPKKALEAIQIENIKNIQLPSNLLDRRFEKLGIFEKAVKLNKLIYVRSIFLQGLLLLNNAELPNKVAFAKPVIKQVKKISQRLKCSVPEVCLGYVKTVFPNAKIVFGVDSISHLENNLTSWNKDLSMDYINFLKNMFINVDEKVLSPAKWI